MSEEGSRVHDALAEAAASEQKFLKQFFSVPTILARLHDKNAQRLRPGRPGQPCSINSLMRRWLAVRNAKSAAAKVADEVAPYFDVAKFGEHLPLLGSAALMQLARDPTNSMVRVSTESGGFLPLLIYVSANYIGRPRPSKRRDHRVLYMRLDVVAACDAFNAWLPARLPQPIGLRRFVQGALSGQGLP
jgi:hypothetical protein